MCVLKKYFSEKGGSHFTLLQPTTYKNTKVQQVTVSNILYANKKIRYAIFFFTLKIHNAANFVYNYL